MKRAAILLATAFALGSLVPAPAIAHENRPVGALTFTVGWGTEPAYAGSMNSVQLRVVQGTAPVTDIPAGAVKVEVTSGSERTTLSLEPAFRAGAFGDPGDYRAYMIPTRAGSYTFRFTGTIRNQEIDASFTSGETTFDSPADPAAIQFPDKAPSSKELADRIEQEVPRLTQANTRLAAALNKAEDEASTAKLLGYIGIGAGALALMLSIAGYSRKRRP